MMMATTTTTTTAAAARTMDHDHQRPDDEAWRLARAISEGATNLLETVETMGPALNSEKMVDRVEALSTLAGILRQLPAGYLGEAEITCLLGYFIAQLKGHHPDIARVAIEAIHTMIMRYTLSSNNVVMFVERFFNEAALVDLTRSDKLALYQIFQCIFTDPVQLDAISKQMSSAAVPGFLQLVELETDPQCLLICFNMFRLVAKNVPLGVYIDEMFDYPANYFPIDFSGTPDRHGGITRKELEESLEECLVAHSAFEEHTVKLCVEKASSDVRQAQIDSLSLLRKAIDHYKPALCLNYLEVIWPLLRKLYIAHREDGELQESVLRTTAVIAHKLGQIDDNCAALEKLSNMIWKDVEDNEAFLEYYGWRLVVACAGGSRQNMNTILPKAFTKLVHMATLDEQQANASLLDASCAMVQTVTAVCKAEHAINVARDGIALPVLSGIEMLVHRACSLLCTPVGPDLLAKFLTLIECALPIEGVLGDVQLGAIRMFVDLCLIKHESSSAIRTDAPPLSTSVLKRFIASCSTFYGQSLTSDLWTLATQHRCVWLLSALAPVGDGDGAKKLCTQLLEIGGNDALAAVGEIVLSYPTQVALSVVEQMLQQQQHRQNSVETIADGTNQCHLAANTAAYSDTLAVAIRETATYHGARVIQTTLEDQHQFLVSACLVRPPRMLLLQLQIILSNCPVTCLADPFGTELASTLLKLADVVDRSNSGSNNSGSNSVSGLDNLDTAGEESVATASTTVDEPSTLICKCIALLANKHAEHSETERILIDGLLSRSSCSREGSDELKTETGLNWPLGVAYLAKGLLMRGHRRCEEALAVALANVSHDMDGAKSFAIIARPEPKLFPREGHCLIRLLYPQRLMTFAMPQLIDRFQRSSDSGERLRICVAICQAIKSVSPGTATLYLPKLEQVILWSLSQACLPPDVSRGLVQCLRYSLPQLKLDVNSVIPVLLKWVQRPGSINLRIEALTCLLDLRKHFQVHELLPYKRRVLRAMPLGDQKRLIRKAASVTALAWHMLGES